MTGAFVSAMGLIEALSEVYDIEVLLPENSTLKLSVESKGTLCHSLPLLEIGRSWRRIILYVPYLLLNTWHLRRLLKARKIDILIVNDYYNLLGVVAKASGWTGALITFVRLMPAAQYPLLNSIWVKLALMFSDKIVGVSRAVVKQLPQSKKIHFIYSCSVRNERHEELEMPIGGEHVICLYLSNYIAGKGHLAALNAFALAHREDSKLRLRFIGGDMGLEKNRKLKRLLVQMAKEMNLEQVVSFEGYCEDVEREIKLSHIVLNFSEAESFSRTCLEASTYGRPIVATRCGGPEEIVVHGVSGFLVNCGDVSAMASAIVKLSRDAESREKMGLAGRRIVQERFSRRQFIEQWNHILAHDC
jgi:L-malate glycosyltransferase